MKTLNEVAENYFNTLNPIAERISSDIIAIKEAYEDLWNCISVRERNQIINETVVHPEAVLKYTLNAQTCDSDFEVPYFRQVSATKYVVDEHTGLTWRDEHSAPFSWKTPSQIDLTILNTSKEEVDKTDLKYLHKKEKTAISNEPRSNDKGLILNFNQSNIICSKKLEKTESKKSIQSIISPPSPNVVLVGTCSKLSGLCSKLKFLPSKSYSYEVQTVINNPNATTEGSILDKIKATAVLKFQNTFKLVGGRGSDKKAGDNKDMENLVQSKSSATVVKLQKPSPKISKPKSPPPPPPDVLKLPSKSEDDNKIEKNLILVKNHRSDRSQFEETDSEKVTLLEENSVQSFLFSDGDPTEKGSQSKVFHELSDDLNSISTECTPLSGPCVDVIPKSGFDFLDNW